MAGNGNSGRRAKPTALHIVNGNPSKKAGAELMGGHALSVSFLVIAADVRQPTMLRQFILEQMRNRQRLSVGQMEWYDQLLGIGTTAETAVNFTGLAFDEIRAQCAMIIAATRSKLTGPEMWAVVARHSITEWEDVDGSRRFAFSKEKGEAIQNLAGYFLPTLRNDRLTSHAVDCLVARIFSNHVKTKVSLRSLEQSFGIGKDTFARVSKTLDVNIRALEERATQSLAPWFVSRGIAACAKFQQTPDVDMVTPLNIA